MAGMLGILDWLSRHSNWHSVLHAPKTFSSFPGIQWLYLGLRYLGLSWSLYSFLSQYLITPSLGGTSKWSGNSIADGMQAICSLALAWFLAGLPGEASCLANAQPLVAVNRFCFNSPIAELPLVDCDWGARSLVWKIEEKGDKRILYLDLWF